MRFLSTFFILFILPVQIYAACPNFHGKWRDFNSFLLIRQEGCERITITRESIEGPEGKQEYIIDAKWHSSPRTDSQLNVTRSGWLADGFDYTDVLLFTQGQVNLSSYTTFRRFGNGYATIRRTDMVCATLHGVGSSSGCSNERTWSYSGALPNH